MKIESRGTVVVARLLLLVSAILIGLVVLLPSDNHQVLGLLPRLARKVAELGIPYWAAFRAIEFGANIVLFVPLGVLIPLAIGSLRARVWWAAVLAGFAISAAIELARLFIPGRVSDSRDLVSNTLGAALGAMIVLVVARCVRPCSPAAPRRDTMRHDEAERSAHSTR